MSPVDGIILDVTTSGCGLLIKTDDGLKILIHLSKDTKTLPSVDMHTKAGDSVCVGQLLCNFIKPHSDDIVCVIITNSDELKSFAVHPGVCDSADYCAAEYSI